MNPQDVNDLCEAKFTVPAKTVDHWSAFSKKFSLQCPFETATPQNLDSDVHIANAKTKTYYQSHQLKFYHSLINSSSNLKSVFVFTVTILPIQLLSFSPSIFFFRELQIDVHIIPWIRAPSFACDFLKMCNSWVWELYTGLTVSLRVLPTLLKK